MFEAILNLSATIEDLGGIPKFTIAVEDEKTYEIIKKALSGIFAETSTVGEIEGLNGEVKIWNQE